LNNTYYIENKEVIIINNDNIQLNSFTKGDMSILHYQTDNNGLFQEKKIEIDTFVKVMNAYE